MVASKVSRLSGDSPRFTELRMLCNDAARQQMNHIGHAVVSLVKFAWKPVWCEPILDGRSEDAATRFIAFVIEIVLPSLLPLDTQVLI